MIHDSFCLGDLVYLGASLAALREQAPSLPISVVVGGLGDSFPFFDNIGVTKINLPVPWDERGWYKRPLRTPLELARAGIGLHSIAGESILADARGDVRHVAVAALAGRRTLSGVSYRSWSRLWGRPAKHIFLDRRDMLWKLQDALGLPKTQPRWPWITVPTQFVDDASSSPTVLLSPGGSGPLKLWDPVRWKQLAAMLRATGIRPIFIREPARKPSILDSEEEWSGTLAQLAQRLASADLVVAIDSLVGHIAAAVGVPTLTLFGPQLPKLWVPWGPHARYVIAEPFSCRPCTQKGCVRPGVSCMDLLELRVVAQAIEDMLGKSSSESALQLTEEVLEAG